MDEVTACFRVFDPINKADTEEEIIDFIRKNHLNVAPFAVLFSCLHPALSLSLFASAQHFLNK